MTDEDVGVDLAAWEAPPAPDVTDAVLARMREPVGAAALESTESSKLRWWIAGGAVAAVAIAVLALVMSRGDDAATGSGAVAATKPSRIDFGASSNVALDADAYVSWVRDDHRLVAMQPRGTASWQVAPDDKLVIDAGATVASVVASGASLRVEVQMHVTEGRLLAGSAVVSAAVALVTVVVYEGTVAVSGAGQTMTVAAGATVEVRPGMPPTQPVPIAELVRQLNDKQLEYERMLNDSRKQQLEPDRDELARRLADKEREIKILTERVEKLTGVGAKPATVPPTRRLTASDIETKLTANRAALVACAGAHDGRIKITMTIAPSGKVTGVLLDLAQFEQSKHRVDASPEACFVKVLKSVDFGASTGGTFGYTWNSPPVVTPTNPCSDKNWIDGTEAKAESYFNLGNHSMALALFDVLLKCKPALLAKTYLVACRARQFPKAKALFQRIPANKQASMAQICMKEGFDPQGP